MKRMLKSLLEYFGGKAWLDWPLAIAVMLYSFLNPWRTKILLLKKGDVWLVIRRGLKFYIPHPLIAQAIVRTTSPPFGTAQPTLNANYGDIVFDVGAGLGRTTTSYSMEVGPKGLVVGIEINPKTYKCLKRNLAMHCSKGNVKVFPKGAFNFTGALPIGTLRMHGGSSLLLKKKKMFLPVDTLDSIAGHLGLSKVDCIAMNIEGSEIEALEGATNILKTCKKVMVSADHKRFGHVTAPEVVAILVKAGFEIKIDSKYVVMGWRE